MLEPYKGPRKSKKFITYDLEWFPGTYEVRLVGTYDGERYRSYKTVEAFLNAELVRKNRHKMFFAHAGGLADVQFVLERIISHRNPNVRVDAAFSGSSAILVWVHHGDVRFLLADSYWLLRDSLKKIGRSLNMEKGGEDYRCPNSPACGHVNKDGKSTCIFWAPDNLLVDYNMMDCMILWHAIDRFQDEIMTLGGIMKPTIASTALTLFRCRFLTQTITTSKQINIPAREAYIASRVEVFRRSCGPSSYYDVNSSFPASMTKPQPGNFLGMVKKRKASFLGLVRADVQVPSHVEIPPIPRRFGERVFFPTGKMSRWFDIEDLNLLEEGGGRILKQHECMSFEPFHELGAYVETIYALRKNEIDEFRRIVYKYLLNSLYGKFGEVELKEGLVINPDVLPVCTRDCVPPCNCVRMLFPGAYLVAKDHTVDHAHVPISVHITALSRSLITRAIWESKEPAYADTDSLITASALPTGKELGALKREKTVGRGDFLAPKFYRLEHGADCDCSSCEKTPGTVEIRAKGFPRLNEAEFKRLAAGEPIEVERMLRIRELYGLGEIRPRDSIDPQTGRMGTKRLHGHLCPCKECGKHPPIGKRCFNEDKVTTRPWSVRELEALTGEV